MANDPLILVVNNLTVFYKKKILENPKSQLFFEQNSDDVIWISGPVGGGGEGEDRRGEGWETRATTKGKEQLRLLTFVSIPDRQTLRLVRSP